MPMRKWHARPTGLFHALSQLHKRHTHRHRRAFTLAETLVALAVTALIMTVGVALVTQWSTGARSLPVLGAREVSDAQVQQMIGELRSAVAVSYITSNEVIAAVTSNGAAGTTPTVSGAKTGPYFVAFYYWAKSQTLFRNGGPSATQGSPAGYSPTISSWKMPTIPTAPSVPPPGAQPAKPSCASPCYDPSGAYWSYSNYYWGGGTAYAGGSAYQGGYGCSGYQQLWYGNGYNQPMGAHSYNISSDPSDEGYLGMQSSYCDWTHNGPLINGGSMAVRYDRSGWIWTCPRSWFPCWTHISVTSIFYVGYSSRTWYYYLPSCGCYLPTNWYSADVSNWNNYRNSLNSYNSAMATWNWEKARWWAYKTNYWKYTRWITAWNNAVANKINTLKNQNPPMRGTTTRGTWPTTSLWRLVADNLSSLQFKGYDTNMSPTTWAARIRTLGVTLSYRGQPIEQEMLTFTGNSPYTDTATNPLVIPPAPPDPRWSAPQTIYSAWRSPSTFRLNFGGNGWGNYGTNVNGNSGAVSGTGSSWAMAWHWSSPCNCTL